MQPVEAFHHLGLLSLVSVFAGLGYILKRWGKVSIMSLSSHAARQRHSYLVFASAITVSCVLFALFMFGWLIPTLGMPAWYSTLTAVALVCALIAAYVPDNGGRNSTIHGIGAWTMAVSSLVLVAGLLFSSEVGVAAKFIASILLSYMVLDWILFLFVKWSHKFFLVFQSSYMVCFYVGMLVAAYLR
jgi:hypothetical protein